MAESNQEPEAGNPPAPKVVTIKRVQIGVNVLIQLAVVAFIVGMVNYISFHHFKRWDISRNQKFVLSQQTNQLLGGLKKPVKAVIFFSGGSDIYGDLVALLREYEYAGKKQFQTEIVDPYRNFTRARDLQAKYKFGANENILILDCDGRSKFVNAADMAEMDQSGAMFGQPPKVGAFKGEQAITSAILELTEEKQNKLYVISGHGEPELNAPPSLDGSPKAESLKALRTYIERQNIKAETLKLLDAEKVPDDARAILIIGPKYDLSDREIKLLRDYWNRKGRMLIALEGGHPLPKMNLFFEENGIRPQEDRVLTTVPMGTVTAIIPDVTAEMKGGSPVTKRLAGIETQFMGYTQSIFINRAGLPTLGTTVNSLIEASDKFWGETEYTEGQPVYNDRGKDHEGPLSIAVSVEKGALADARVSVDTARMIVVGNGDFLRDDALTESGLDFALSGFNWLLNREDLIGIAPKERKAFNLNLSEEQLARIFLVMVCGIPSIVAVLGVFSWWQRRR